MSRWVLARSERPKLAAFARSRSLVALDFDGTLAPIVDDPALARLDARTRRSLVALARAYPCAVISGRARSDVASRLRGVPLVAVVGNHGMERTAAGRAARADVRRWQKSLAPLLAGADGVWLEDKGFSLSVHYRHAPNRARAGRFVARTLDGLTGARLVAGKAVWNVVPRSAPHKGDAVAALCRRFRCTHVLFVGDDVTDEDVFVGAGPRLLAVRVGIRRSSAAPHHLRSQAEMGALLDLLTLLRTDTKAAR